MPSAPSPRRKGKRLPLPDLSYDGVQQVRTVQRGGGPNALMHSSWRDPTDTSPTAARHARQVSGWRTFCPLRKMAAARGSSISDAHIHAADMLRQSVDAAGIGFSAEKDDLPVTALVYGPKAGPSKRDQASETAYRDLRRLFRQFTPDQAHMLDWIILRNWTLYAFCEMQQERTGRKPNPHVEMGKLLGILENLVAYYQTDIDQGLTAGRILPV